MDSSGYYDYNICKECRGRYCCQHRPCAYIPQDIKFLQNGDIVFEKKLELLKKEITKGRISIDKIPSSRGMLYLRARAQNSPIVQWWYTMDLDKDYPCVHWTWEAGCALDAETRPAGGRMVKPSADKQCEAMLTWSDLQIEWYPFQKMLKLLVDHFANQ